jgi:peptidoglycan/LPS O-acetylase OafA/YrhL
MLLALLSWHLFEKHFLKLKRLFPYETRLPLPLVASEPPAPLDKELSAVSILRPALTSPSGRQLNPPAHPNA